MFFNEILNINNWKILALRDDCTYATLTQLASAPLTALSVYMKMGLQFNDTFTLHLVGKSLRYKIHIE